jgi:hypothetical protein
MKVKDTRIFRDFYKSNIGQDINTNRNPHYAGRKRSVDGKDEFGFFSMFHGPNKEMKNLLKTILEMALDSQALYEFMQNAVDAKSSDFLMFHHYSKAIDQDYLIVLNNGDPFNLQGVLSILDIGASTKFGDAETIGQFGVGFKLAHRLVGEDAGLVELIEENKGPILFSWSDSDLFQLTGADEDIIPADPLLEGIGDNAICKSDIPWLFKILFTNFPCLPGEEIIDAKGRFTGDAFTADEKALVKEVAIRCAEREITKEDFAHGTLLIIPLHKKKIHEVTKNTTADGLPIASAIINNRKGHQTLKRVLLNDEKLEVANVEFEPFRFDVAELKSIETEDDQKLLKGVPKIEIDFCYSDPFSDEDPFRNKPQFYLYFPMTEERHGFRFAIHCNAFSFTSARTALQENTQRNKLLFRLFTENLEKKLIKYSKSDNERFLKIYASIVLSQRGVDGGNWKANRDWLESDFWLPLMAIVSRLTPCQCSGEFTLIDAEKGVFVKDSNLPLQEWHPTTLNWFYWNTKDHWLLCHLASSKLALGRKTVFDAIENTGSYEKINSWLSESRENARLFIDEIEDFLKTEPFADWKEDRLRNFWSEKIAKLKLWWIGDQNYSANQLASSASKSTQNKIILYGPLADIKDIMISIAIEVSDIDLEKFEKLKDRIRKHFQSLLPYISEHEALISHINQFFVKAETLSKGDKKRIFDAFYNAVGTDDKARRISKLKELVLFTNRRPGEIKKLRLLISDKAKVPKILNSWRINLEETNGIELEEYLAQTPSDIYYIILDSWNEITSVASTDEDREELFHFITGCYIDGMPPIPAKNIFFSSNGFVPHELPHYYHERLSEVNNYSDLCSAAVLTGIGALPQLSLLPFYQKHPFMLSQGAPPNLKLDGKKVLTVGEATALLQFCLMIDPSFLKRYTVKDYGDSVIIENNVSKTEAYYSEDTFVNSYVETYHAHQLTSLSKYLAEIAQPNLLQEQTLYAWLVKKQPSDRKAATLLAQILMRSSDPDKRNFLSNQQPFDINCPIVEGELEEKLLKLAFSMSPDTIKPAIDKLLYLIDESNQIPLSKLNNRGSDTLTITWPGGSSSFSIAELLGGKQVIINGRLSETAKKWADMNISSPLAIEEGLAIKQMRQPAEVRAEMMQQCNRILHNSEQLRFTLTHAMLVPQVLAGISIQTMAGPQPIEKRIFYWRSTELESFIPAEIMLTDAYKPFDGKGIDNNTKLVSWPTLDNAGTFIIPGVPQIVDEARQKALIKFLVGLWKIAERPQIITWHSGSNDWLKLIGISPKNLLLEDRVTLPEETLDWNKIGIENTADNQAFIQALGAMGVDSDVAKFRMSFLDLSIVNAVPVNDKKWAINSLKWLAVSEKSVSLNQIEPLYATVSIAPSELLPPVPVIRPTSHDYYLLENTADAYYLTKDQTEKLKERGVPYSKVASVAGRDTVPYNHCVRSFDARLQKHCKVLEIKWSVVNIGEIRTSCSLWQSNAYQKWKQEDNSRPDIFGYGGMLPVDDTVFGESIYSYHLGDIADLGRNVFAVNIFKTEKGVAQELSVKYPNSANWALLIRYIDEDASYFQQIVSLAKVRTETKELLERLIKNIEDTEERQKKANLVNNPNARYTLEWFENLLDLVKAQEKKVGLPDIKFRKCSASIAGPDIYELSDTDGTIPTGIEDFPSINASISYSSTDGTNLDYSTSLQAHYSYRKLKVHFPAGLPSYLTPGNITSVTLSFITTLDLMAELKSAFKRLNYVPTYNLKQTLSHNIQFLFGPPGTGKTTTLARRIIDRMNDGVLEPIIVLTPTNKAANVLTKKIIEEYGNAAPSWLIRTGNCIDSSLLSAGIVRNDLVVNHRTAIVIITTIHRFCYQKVRKTSGELADTRLCDCPWQQVIFDESSMIPLAYIVHAIHARQREMPDTEFLVAGDPLQIPPVFDLVADDIDDIEELQLQNIYKMVGLESFIEAEQQLIPIYGQHGRIENLTTQYRSISSIGELFSRFQYGGRIAHGRTINMGRKPINPRPLPKYFAQDLKFKPITLIRYKVRPGETVFNPRHINKSPLHIYISLFVSELVKTFKKEVESEKMAPWTMGVLAPYRAQANMMGNLIDGHTMKSSLVTTSIDTVHGFQGDENDIVLAVLNPTNVKAHISRFLKKPYIMNVAISRAEDYLILFVPDEDTQGMNYLEDLQNLLSIIYSLPKSEWCELNAWDIEPKLLPSENFIADHSFITSHQNVNIYGKPLYPYFIRICNSSVDVHWEEEPAILSSGEMPNVEVVS